MLATRNMLNELEAAVQEHNDLLDSVLRVHLNNNDEEFGQFFCLRTGQWKPIPDYTWKANEAI